jgi:hypothetical protein
VVLRRGGETFEVLLYDPSKPRSSAAPAGVQLPETGAAGRPVIRRPPTTVPGPVPTPQPPPGPGFRAPGRTRVPQSPPVPPPSPDEQESSEEE